MTEISLQEYSERIAGEIEQGRYAEAIAHGKQILEHYPKHVATYRLLGEATLEAGHYDHAEDMFRRVLSADTENLLAWVGLSEVYNQRGDLDAAVWHMERAFELSSDAEVIGEQLRHLYGRQRGVELQKIELTRGALARLYLKGDLLSRAISELSALVEEYPERVDLSIALAEALWRDGQRLKASEVCQQILDSLPHCLKANLILGEIWVSSGREEAQMYLRRAEALDPEGLVAQQLFGSASPLRSREVTLTLLDYRPPTEEERPSWMEGMEAVATEGPLLTDQDAMLIDVSAGLKAQIEIPAWLEELGAGGEMSEAMAPAAADSELAEAQGVQMPAEEVPRWVSDIGEDLIGEKPEAGREKEPGDWLRELRVGETEEEDVSEWLKDLPIEPVGEEGVSSFQDSEKVPEWPGRADLDMAGPEVTAQISSRDESPDWLASLRDQIAGEAGEPEETSFAAAEDARGPDWEVSEPSEFAELQPAEGIGAPVPDPLADESFQWIPFAETGALLEAEAELQEETQLEPFDWTTFGPPPSPTEEVRVTEESAATAEAVTTPTWLQGEELSSDEEALAWLEQLAEAKEEDQLAEPKAEGDAPIAEIMGRPAQTEPSLDEIIPGEAAGAVGEPFGWTTFAPSEPASPAEEWLPREGHVPSAEAVPATTWLEGEKLPAGDEALAWLERISEGRAAELRALAEEGGERRIAEVRDRPASVEPEAGEITPEEGEAAVEEPLGWTTFVPPELVSPAEEVLLAEEAVPPPEEVPAVEEVADELTGLAVPETPLEEEEFELPPAVIEPSVMPEEAAPPSEAQLVEDIEEAFAAERAHLQEHPRDYEAWLALARALWQDDERQEALGAYGHVIRSAELVGSVITDLEGYVAQWPDVGTQQMLGDAYMRDGRPQEALDIYRRALRAL